jgi:hypothetical protein
MVKSNRANQCTIVRNELMFDLPVDDTELVLLEMYIGDIIREFNGQSE